MKLTYRTNTSERIVGNISLPDMFAATTLHDNELELPFSDTSNPTKLWKLTISRADFLEWSQKALQLSERPLTEEERREVGLAMLSKVAHR